MSVAGRITVGDFTLLPIIRTLVRCYESTDGVSCLAQKDVVGVVVVCPTGRNALDLQGQGVPVEKYLEMVPGLEDLLQL